MGKAIKNNLFMNFFELAIALILFCVLPIKTYAVEYKNVESQSLIKWMMEDDNLENGYYALTVNGVVYNIHLYVFDGDQNWTTNQTFGDANDVGASGKYAQNMVAVLVRGNITIASGVTVTAYKTTYGGPKGMFLYTAGTLENNGTISMYGRGAYAVGQDVYLWYDETNGEGYNGFTVPATGAAGATRSTTSSLSNNGHNALNGNNGANGTGRATGGGGSGSVRNYVARMYPGSGAAGTSYSGGTGGGAAATDRASSRTAGNGGANGGPGGCGAEGGASTCNTGGSTNGWGQCAGGGQGNGSGNMVCSHAVFTVPTQDTGTGGLLILFAGNLNNKGTITADGVKSLYFSVSKWNGSQRGGHRLSGGSSGGGSVNIFYSNLESIGTTTAAGGARQTSANWSGGAGGNGTVTLSQLILEEEFLHPTLSTLTVDKGSFSPSFNPETKTYYVTLPTEESYVNIKAEPNHPENTITSGVGEFNIPSGTSTHNIVLTSKIGLVEVYKVEFYRPPSSYPYLKDIKIDDVSIEGFSSTKLNYNVNVPYNSDEIDINAIAGRGSQQIFGDGKISLKSGQNKIVITVISEDGNSTIDYVLNINRAHSSRLKILTAEGTELNPEFDPETLTYSVDIMSTQLALNLEVIPYDEEATYTLKGFGYIKNSQTGTITVTEPNSQTTEYKINIHKDGAPAITNWTYGYTGEYQVFIAPAKGYYQFELWGAQGGNSVGNNSVTCSGNRGKAYGSGCGGFGSYTTGTVLLNKDDKVYIYVGQRGYNGGGNKPGGWNGGGSSTYDHSDNEASGSGGGATDIRIVPTSTPTKWNEFDSLKSRIMVAAGGGGGSDVYVAGNGGTLQSVRNRFSNNATQTTGYAFGYGENAVYRRGNIDVAGGGGGYFGGFSTAMSSGNYGNYGQTGTGGSSFVSGCTGCVAISEESTAQNNIVFLDSNIHYSGIEFTDIQMIAGGYSMPSTNTGYITGNAGNGYARVTMVNKSENNFLSGINLKAINYETEEKIEKNYTPNYELEVEDYYVTLDSMETELNVTAKPEDSKAKIQGLGSYDIPAGTTDIPITVTAEAGNIKIYTVHVTRDTNKNPYPNDIIVNGLVPSLCIANDSYCHILNSDNVEMEFDKNTHTYYVTVPSRIKQLYFNVDPGHPYQTISGEGKVSLEGGENNITITVLSEAAKDKTETELVENVDYTVYNYVVTRDMTGNTDLSHLEIIEPYRDINYDPDITEYYASIPNQYKTWQVNPDKTIQDFSCGEDADPDCEDENKLQLFIETDDPNASFITSGPDELIVGLNEISIFVTAANGEVKTYVLNIYREKNENVYLRTLTITDDKNNTYPITPEFNKIKTGTYYATVPNEINGVTINADSEVNTTTVTGTGYKPLVTTKANVFTITTTAQNGTIETYKVSITRQKNNNTDLDFIRLEYKEKEYSLDPSFDNNIKDYKVDVDEGVSSISITSKPTINTTKYRLLDNSTIKVGTNIKRVMAVAEDGTSKTFTINIYRPASTNNYLSSLNVTNGTNTFELIYEDESGIIKKGFDKEITDYKLEVENDITFVNVNGIKDNNLSTISGNGKYSLSVGKNDISVTVKSESGDMRTYNISITRKPNSNAFLKSITTSEGIIVPTFDKTEQKYTVNVENTVNDITITGISEVSTTSINGTKNKFTHTINNLASGTTIYELITLAEDGITSITYTLEIIKDKSDNDNISRLVLKEGILSPKFNPDIVTYEASVPYETTQGTFIVELEDSKATYEIKNNENFIVGENEVIIEVTSESGYKKEYKVTITRQDETTTNNYLESLSTDKGILNPIFNKNTQYYEVTVPYEVTKITISGKAEDNTSTVSGLGTYTLNVGNENLIGIRVTTVDGSTRDYQIVVNRLKNTDARLSSLVLTDAVLSPSFNKDIYEYTTATTDKTLKFSKIIPLDSNASYEIIGNDLTTDAENEVIIRVTAEDGVSQKDYVIKVSKSPSKNNNLSNLEVDGYTINPNFNKSTTLYNLTVGNDINSINVIALPEDVQATITGDGVHSLNVGPNYVTVEVTSEAGTIKSYTIVVTKEGSNNNYLKDLKLNNGTMNGEFNKETPAYDMVVEYEETSLNLSILTEDENATYQILNNDLKVGNNTVTVAVTAEDGSIRNYILHVTRKEIVSALLENVTEKNYSLNPVFNSYINNYNIDVNYETTKLDLSIITKDKKATYTVTGNENFIVGDNTVTIEVTSSNGVDKELYTLNVTRQPYANTFLDYLYTDNGDVTPKFNQTTMSYTINVANTLEQIELFGEPVDKSTTVTTIFNSTTYTQTKGDNSLGVYNLNTGENEIYINVKSISGVTRSYKVIVNRSKDGNTRLNSLHVETKSKSLDATKDELIDNNTFLLTVPAGTPNVTITANAVSETSKVSGTGTFDLKTGTNTYTLTVTAEDESTREYIVIVEREKSSNNLLTDIIPSSGTLEPLFDYTKTDYVLNLDSSVSVLSFEAYTEDPGAIVSGTEIGIVPDGISTRIITVKAENGDIKTYTITINKERTDNALLSELSVTGYDFVDEFGNKVTFDPANTEYTINVPNDKKILQSSEVIAIAADPNSKISKGTNLMLSTTGDNKYTVIVTAPDGFTKQIYTISVKKELSNNADLNDLKVNIGSLQPGFNPTVTEYVWLIPKNVVLTKDNVIVVTSDTNATVNKTETLTYTKDGDNTFIVQVVSEDGTTSSTFKLKLELDLSNDATLKELNVDKGYYKPSFDPETHTYDVFEYEDETEIEITAIPSSETSIVLSGDGIITLDSDVTQTTIIVTAEDGTTEEYTINIHRNILKDEGLKDLYLNGLDNELSEDDERYDDKLCIDDKCILNPTFNTDVINYSIKVPYEYTNLDVLAKTMNNQQTVKIKVDDEYIEDYKLPLGKTNVTIEVYDGMNKLTRTYNLEVERCKSNNTYLKELNISHNNKIYDLYPDFNKKIQEYTIYIEKDIEEVDINAVPEDTNSLATPNGYNYLTEGENDATVIVSAPDGSERMYIIHIIKSGDENSYIKNITVSTGIFWDLTPKFRSTVYEYTTTVSSTSNKATIEAIPVDPTTVITGTGEYDLNTGSNIFTLTATSLTGASVSIYKVNVIKESSKNVDLASLKVKEGELKPNFERGITKYHVDVDEDVNKLTIEAIPEDKSSTIKITGNENLITGNNIINIIVESKDKSTSKTYQLIVNKSANSNNRLTNIKVFDTNNNYYSLDPAYNENQLTYDVIVPYNIEKVKVESTVQNKFATVIGNGDVYLNNGNNTHQLFVTAENGSVNIYTLNIYREYNLSLKTLVSDIGTLDPVFNKEVLEYNINLENDQDEITFVALPESSKVTTTGSGTYNLSTGDNEILFTVSDPDGHTKEYKVIVNRKADDNNYIKELNVDGILSPAFDKNTQEYQVDVRDNVKSLSELTYKLESDTATAKVVGNENFTSSKNPNVVVIRVTAENGTTRDYKLNVMLQPDIYFSNRLSSLTIDNGTLTPDFHPDINNYAVTVSNSVTELNIEGIPENERAIVTGDGLIKLSVGRNVIPITVKAQDGSINEYDVIVYRTEPNDATLQSLSVTGHDYLPLFSKLTTEYSMEIGSEIDELDVIAIPTDNGATVKISGNKNLVSGDNTINILVTAPDKITTKTYTIKVNKAISKNNYLSDLNIPDYNFTTSFVKTNQGPYVVNVPSDVNTININATPEAKTSTVNGDGVIKLVGGKNVVTVRVTAESGDVRDYTLIINKALSSDATLKDILLSDESLDPLFNPNTYEYTVTVPEELNSITITGIVNDSSATITGNGTYDITDDFIVNLVVTAEDGNKTTYKVNIHRDIPASSYLKQLIVKDGELYPGFHKLITNYTILVPNEVRSLNMEYAPEDEKATVNVTGNENFKVGTNKVHIVVTATDGTSTDYELAVVRQTIASNYLKSLSIDGYTIKPTFDKTNMYYEVTVPEDVDIVKIKAAPEDSTSTLTGTGYKSLKVGTNVAYVTVESASGVIRTYQIVINRTASSENYLLTLESDIGTLSPIFDKEVKDYVLEVPDKTNKITLTGTASENSIVNGLGTYDVPLGEITRTITVTSQSGEVNTYTIKTVKNSATNTNLIDLIPSNGSINPEYSNDVLEYTMEVEDNVNVISFLANPEDKDATVTTDDIMVLSYGENIYHVKVVAEDGITERNITIRINRKKNLKSITASEEKVFLDLNDTYNLSYTINPEDTTYPDVEWTIDDESIATIDENGLVKGIKYGSTIARITSKHDSTIYDTVNIIVMSKKILSSKYEIQRNEIDTPDDEKTIEYIIGIEPKTSIEDFKDNLDNENSMIFVYDLEGNEYSGSYVGTGLIVKYEFEGNVLDELTIVVRGDLNSDGDITTADYVKMKNYILKKVDFNEIEMIAGDLTKSSSIGTTDYVKLKNYILKKITSVN